MYNLSKRWIAQLFAGEGEAQGQVIAVDANTGEQTVLLSELNKPTGITVLDNALWIAEESQLLQTELDSHLLPQQPEVVLSEMPNNGRSNATLRGTQILCLRQRKVEGSSLTGNAFDPDTAVMLFYN